MSSRHPNPKEENHAPTKENGQSDYTTSGLGISTPSLAYHNLVAYVEVVGAGHADDLDA